ncbi:hypothetical protein [Enterobacter sp. Bisph1]|uniref:hypothetical protein n=1 Tax=Enterobacter sp. Bisph1 TaxID=1274399 RepID=UPI00057C227A|nr:hypothetical protein [Enterobacter sp. Bisph1]
MPVTQRMSVPKVKHFGFYFDIDSGFADIAGKKNLPVPAKTLLTKGAVYGTADETGNNNLYSFTDGFQDELIITLYEQLSGTGEMVYLHENNPDFFTKRSKFLSKIDPIRPHRLFATFTGGNSLWASHAARFVGQQLKQYDFQSVVWNTWSWLPPRFSFCMLTSYVVRLDLKTGDVKSFKTNCGQVERFLLRNNFLEYNRLAVRESRNCWLREWFDNNKEFSAFRKRALELSQKDPSRYTFKMLSALDGDNSFLLLYYEKYRNFPHDIAIASDPYTEFLILLPNTDYALPQGWEQNKLPAENKSSFIFEQPTVEQPQRRHVKKESVTQVRVKPSAILLHYAESPYTIQESEMFSAQRKLLINYCGKEAKETLARINSIVTDLAAGRLPRKSVEHYFVADLPTLSRNKGRGAWRLLITRKGKVLTLYVIADYHNGIWKQWS